MYSINNAVGWLGSDIAVFKCRGGYELVEWPFGDKKLIVKEDSHE